MGVVANDNRFVLPADIDYARAAGGYRGASFVLDFLAACVEEGYIELTGTVLPATRVGRRRLDAMLPQLLL